MPEDLEFHPRQYQLSTKKLSKFPLPEPASPNRGLNHSDWAFSWGQYVSRIRNQTTICYVEVRNSAIRGKTLASSILHWKTDVGTNSIQDQPQKAESKHSQNLDKNSSSGLQAGLRVQMGSQRQPGFFCQRTTFLTLPAVLQTVWHFVWYHFFFFFLNMELKGKEKIFNLISLELLFWFCNFSVFCKEHQVICWQEKEKYI